MSNTQTDSGDELQRDLMLMVGQGTEFTPYDTKMLLKFIRTREREARINELGWATAFMRSDIGDVDKMQERLNRLEQPNPQASDGGEV